MRILKHYILSIVLLMQLTTVHSMPFHKDRDINTPNAIASPKTLYRLLFTSNAKYAELVHINKMQYKLILLYPDPNINYLDNQLNKNGTFLLHDLISLWPSNNKLFIHADITGIQVNRNTFGHTQFYASVLLNNPKYDSANNELTFSLLLIEPNVNMDKSLRFDNATMFMNGCDVCDCKNKEIHCNALLK